MKKPARPIEKPKRKQLPPDFESLYRGRRTSWSNFSNRYLSALADQNRPKGKR